MACKCFSAVTAWWRRQTSHVPAPCRGLYPAIPGSWESSLFRVLPRRARILHAVFDSYHGEAAARRVPRRTSPLSSQTAPQRRPAANLHGNRICVPPMTPGVAFRETVISASASDLGWTARLCHPRANCRRTPRASGLGPRSLFDMAFVGTEPPYHQGDRVRARLAQCTSDT